MRSPLHNLNSHDSLNEMCNKKGFKIDYSTLTIYQVDHVILKNTVGDIFIGSLSEKEEKNG